MSVIICGCRPSFAPIDPSEVDNAIAAATLVTSEDVERAFRNALNSERAIVFVHMDWAANMGPQRAQFIRFMLAYHQRFPDQAIGFHYIDCTPITSDYTLLKSLPGWPGTGDEIYAQSGTGGCGDVIWIERGVVQHVEWILDLKNPSHLIAQTRKVFAPKGVGT